MMRKYLEGARKCLSFEASEITNSVFSVWNSHVTFLYLGISLPTQSKQQPSSISNKKRASTSLSCRLSRRAWGLNVTAANHIIHFSHHWNPAKENQATDRAYCIGQTKDVYVYYPMAVSNHFKAFDETLDELLSRKIELATSTIFPAERVEVNKDELAQMLFGELEV